MNLPNKITLIRIILIPIFMFFFMADFIPWGKFIACVLFAVASLTDFLDGKIARKTNQCTNLGKFLDTIADKLLVIAGLIMLVAYPITGDGITNAHPIIFPEYIGIICAFIIIARELVIGAFKAIASNGSGMISAKQLARVKAGFQMVTLIYYFFYAFLMQEYYSAISGTINTVISVVGYVLLGVTVILTIVTAIQYFVGNKQVLKDEK